MSALEQIFQHLMLGEMEDTTEGYRRRIEPSLRREAQALYDAVAHELAELQRLRMEELDLTGQKARIVGRIVDLIDPEVSSDG